MASSNQRAVSTAPPLYRDGHTIVPKGKLDGDSCGLYPPSEHDDCLSPEMSLSAMQDIARLVPELAPLCAPALNRHEA
jgi:hypothetical protein